MTVIAEFTLPAPSFALEETFEQYPDLEVEVERLATHSRHWVMPFLWLTADALEDDLETVATIIEVDSTVTEVEILARGSSQLYCNIRWTESVKTLVDLIVDRRGIVRTAAATEGTWHLDLQFVDRDALEAFESAFHGEGYGFELRRLYDATSPVERRYGLTRPQYAALITALELGYFEIPRGATVEAVADELGVSSNAASERIRRAVHALTANTVANPGSGPASTVGDSTPGV